MIELAVVGESVTDPAVVVPEMVTTIVWAPWISVSEKAPHVTVPGELADTELYPPDPFQQYTVPPVTEALGAATVAPSE
jgi:hypothetical protein